MFGARRRRPGAAGVLVASLLVLLLLLLPSQAGAVGAPTTVSLTFDDGTANHYDNALPGLEAHAMHGTFYVMSGELETSSKFLTWDQLRALSSAGNEIAGHTVLHEKLTTLTYTEAAREICNDRVNLINQGFQPTDFAYPNGAYDATIQGIAESCGYNSARTVGGILSPFDEACTSGCPLAENIPPVGPYAVRTPDSVVPTMTLQQLETLVTQAENGGGWVPIVFHDVCEDACTERSISVPDFNAFLDWLQQQREEGAVAVKTVHEVIGGPLRPGVPGPAPTGSSLQNASLENKSNGEEPPTCWQQGGFGANTASFTRIHEAHSGSWGGRLAISNYQGGGAVEVVTQDEGECAPTVTPGRAYKIGLWYQSSAKISLVAFYRDQLGAWHYLATSPDFPPASSWTDAQWTTPMMPSTATAISFGPDLETNGSVTFDDASLELGPPTVGLVGLTSGAVYSGTQTLTAEPGVGTDDVEFLVNGSPVGVASSPPWSVTWDTRSVANGPATITARAVDADGASSSFSASISIDNTGATVKDASLEWDSNADSVPDCFQPAGYGNNTFSFSRTHDAHSGEWAEEIEITSLTGGDRKLLPSMDEGQCAPAVVPDETYALSSWYEGNVHPYFVVYTRNTSGEWSYWTSSTDFASSPNNWAEATWTTPPIPADVTNVSFGLDLDAVGVLRVDDFAIACAGGCEPPPLDTTAPSSAASAPASSASASLTISYEASDGEGSGLAQVDLYAKGPGQGAYSKVASDSSPTATGSFSYTAAGGDGAYSFYTVAADNAGNVEDAPGSPDATTVLDTTAPSSAASAPASSASASLTISYEASDGEGSGLAQVDLYAKGPGQGAYSKVASDSSPTATGSFSYTAAGGDGAYSFYTVAADNAGNVEDAPGSPDATTVLDTTAPSSAASAPASSASASLTISYEASDGEGSGLAQVDLYAKGPGQGAYSKVASDSSPTATGSFSYTAAGGDGAYSFYTVAADNAGNVEDAPGSPDATTVLDTTAPSSAASAPASSASASLTISYEASDGEGSGLAQVDLYAKGPGQGAYSKVASDSSPTATGSFSYTAAGGDGAYSFYTVAADNAGNVEDAPGSPDATTVLDTTAPSSAASAPASSASASLTISYEASDGEGSGLAQVDLYAKGPGQGAYSKVASDSSPTATGSFSYTAAGGDGAYSFYTVAADNAGNVEDAPGSPDATTVLDTTDGVAPTSKASSIAFSNSLTWTVSYTASDNAGGSGLASVELWALPPGATGYVKVASNPGGDTSDSFSYTATGADGVYSLYTIAVDQAGNREPAPAKADTSTLLDLTAPSALAMADPGKYLHGTVKLSPSSPPSDSGSGMASVTYEYRADGDQGPWQLACTKGSAPWGCNFKTAGIPDGSYELRAIAADRAGNITVASNTLAGIAFLNTRPTAAAIATSNVDGGTAGMAEPGDSITFTYSTTLLPSSILSEWTGTSTPVVVRLEPKSRKDTLLTVWRPIGNLEVALASPLDLGGVYASSSGANFNATMAQSGPAITVTLGSLVSGSLSAAPVSGGTLKWTPSPSAMDPAGNMVSKTKVSTPGPAF